MIEKEIIFDVTRRPGLAYQHAFDWLAANLYAVRGEKVVITNELWHAVEILRRLPNITLLDPPAGVEQVAGELGADPLLVAKKDVSSIPAIGIIKPLQSQTFDFEVLCMADFLYLIFEGRLARFMEYRLSSSFSKAIGDIEYMGALQERGFTLNKRLEIHKPRTAFQHYLGELALVLKRRDYRDRRHYAMRRDFVSANSANGWSALICLEMEREG